MKRSLFSLAIIAGVFLSCQPLSAADDIKTYEFQGLPSDVQLPPNYPVPDFAQPNKVDVVETELDNLKARVESLEEKLKACGCEKKASS